MAIWRYNPGAFPRATMALVGLNIALALGDLLTGAWFEQTLLARGIDIYYGQWWRIPGCTMVHANLMHLAFNAYGIYVLGRILEQLQGWRAVLIVYVVSALGGAGLGVAFMDPAVSLLGASGAAYGLMGAVLGFFYVKTGSLRGLWEVPASRQLLIWLLVGVYISTLPGISLLGHLGGFVPGVMLGVYYEYRYTRRLDLFHRLSVGAMIVAVLALCVYAAVPWHRGEYTAARALRAYEQGEMARGDELLKRAEGQRSRPGGAALIGHLKAWRAANARDPARYDARVLRLALRTTEPGRDGRMREPMFLTEDMAESLEQPADAP